MHAGTVQSRWYTVSLDLVFCLPVCLSACLVVATLAGCSTSTGSDTPPTPTLGPVPAPQGPVATTGSFAYAANTSSHTISGYLIDSATGALTPMPGSPFAAGTQPNSISIAEISAGKFAYVANTGSDNVSAYEIQANGVLTPVPGSPFAAGDLPGSLAVAPTSSTDPRGEFVYVVNSGTNNVSAYKIESNGGLTPVPGSPFNTGAGPQGIAVDQTGQFAYAVNFDSADVTAYKIETNGALTVVSGSPFPAAGSGPNVITVSASNFVYAVNFQSSNVSVYDMNLATGALTKVGTFNTGAGPEGIAIATNGSTGQQFAYIGNGISHDVSAYTIGADGKLTEIFPRVRADNDPEGMAVDSTGKFVYAVNHESNKVSAYTIDPSTGALTPVPGSPFPF